MGNPQQLYDILQLHIDYRAQGRFHLFLTSTHISQPSTTTNPSNHRLPPNRNNPVQATLVRNTQSQDGKAQAPDTPKEQTAPTHHPPPISRTPSQHELIPRSSRYDLDSNSLPILAHPAPPTTPLGDPGVPTKPVRSIQQGVNGEAAGRL